MNFICLFSFPLWTSIYCHCIYSSVTLFPVILNSRLSALHSISIYVFQQGSLLCHSASTKKLGHSQFMTSFCDFCSSCMAPNISHHIQWVCSHFFWPVNLVRMCLSVKWSVSWLQENNTYLSSDTQFGFVGLWLFDLAFFL